MITEYYNEVGNQIPTSLLEQMIDQATDLGIEIPISMLPVIEVEPEEADILNEAESKINVDNIEEIEIVDDNIYYYFYTNFNTVVNPELTLSTDNIVLDKNTSILIDTLQNLYNNDFDIYNGDGSIVVLLYYKDITIRNSSPYTHNIKSLFVKIRLIPTKDQKMFRFCSFEGARFYITDLEQQSNYRHSHLPRSTSLGSFSSFCIGDGIYNTYCKAGMTLPTKTAVDYIGLSADTINPTLDDIIISLQSFFIAIDNYVQWESTEGGPYIRFSSLGVKLNTISMTSFLNWDVDVYMSKFTLYLLKLQKFVIEQVDIKYENNVLSNINDIYSVEYIINIIPNDLISQLPNGVLCYYDDGIFYECSNDENTVRLIEDNVTPTTFKFRHKPVKHIIKKTIIDKYTNLIVRPNVILAIIADYRKYLLLNT